ncbi:hypothetical protein Anapl_06081 [Anas platyrhynchos]|uniref:Uncharacterized protein n=1 Tax=Anas platyrhynchos TaxID=8839 RepID=R0L9B2_ANAPL|nr:hypothetical protein Anapl_06081 [Anas platyrhynchos]
MWGTCGPLQEMIKTPHTPNNSSDLLPAAIVPIPETFPIRTLEVEGLRSHENLQQHASSSVINFCIFKLPRHYWCHVHLHPICKKTASATQHRRLGGDLSIQKRASALC